MLDRSTSNPDQEIHLDRAKKLFDGISVNIKLHFLILWFIFIANFIARFTRLISFYGFSNQLSTTLGWNLNKYQNMAITLSAGGEVTKNDFAVFGESIEDTLRNIATSWKLEKARDERAGNFGWCNFFSRPIRTAWNSSPYCYSIQELEDADSKLIQKNMGPSV